MTRYSSTILAAVLLAASLYALVAASAQCLPAVSCPPESSSPSPVVPVPVSPDAAPPAWFVGLLYGLGALVAVVVVFYFLGVVRAARDAALDLLDGDDEQTRR